MTADAWHAPTDLLERFATAPESLDTASAASIETHLVRCPACRQHVAAASPVDLELSWLAIADTIDAPRVSITERGLRRFGVSDVTARVVAATPGLRAGALASIALVAGLAVLWSRTSGADGPFLVAAPLLPLAGVAATFAPAGDPAGEAGVATPAHGVSLVLRRAVAVLATSLAVLIAAAFFLPAVGVSAAAWLLPALAVSLLALALGSAVRAPVAVATSAGVWLVAVAAVRVRAGLDTPIIDTATFAGRGQFLWLTVAAISVFVLRVRRDAFTTLETI